jgi:hypothetical protein
MSDYETREGKIRMISKTGESLEDSCKRIWIDNGEPIEDYEYGDFRDKFYDKYFSVDDKLWEILENHDKGYQDSFCKLTENPDGTMNFYTTYYNGGACETEMIEWELKRLNKLKNKN